MGQPYKNNDIRTIIKNKIYKILCAAIKLTQIIIMIKMFLYNKMTIRMILLNKFSKIILNLIKKNNKILT